ncbi:hypothetical protein [Actinomadura rubrisoli]|uniref:Septum formation-related domain-containing protein n=1 Tax=Actinomadura rubrisoli TaxID=2530368 RepID=A0A4R5BS31_9ACTN|nr:hypothetical protein [Actinomadura rubrisoli]TDD89818.1 hypothetical protein E1298_13880 [Actinomadura rubrisoli]
MATPPPFPAPGTYGPPVQAVPRRTNRFAIAALVTGLLGLLLLVIGFAIAAFVQSGRRNEKGRGLAIAGLAASAARRVSALLCTQPHEGKVVDEKRLADGPYPGEQQTVYQASQASQACKGWLPKYAKSRIREAPDGLPDPPGSLSQKRRPPRTNRMAVAALLTGLFGTSVKEWDEGARAALCLVLPKDGPLDLSVIPSR